MIASANISETNVLKIAAFLVCLLSASFGGNHAAAGTDDHASTTSTVPIDLGLFSAFDSEEPNEDLAAAFSHSNIYAVKVKQNPCLLASTSRHRAVYTHIRAPPVNLI